MFSLSQARTAAQARCAASGRASRCVALVVAFIYPYVGPAEVLRNSHGSPAGQAITDGIELRRWLSSHPGAFSEGATFVVGVDHVLRLADRRSEHVACAGEPRVLAAGEMGFALGTNRIEVVEVSNQSAGFCPAVDCWVDVERSLDMEGVVLPRGFTRSIEFRRCPRCAEINLVKEAWFVCVFCDHDLPREWNVSVREPLP